ncbi:hypothetical protein L195_g062222, partial [Trifolium pratense]
GGIDLGKSKSRKRFVENHGNEGRTIREDDSGNRRRWRSNRNNKDGERREGSISREQDEVRNGLDF